MDEKVPCFFTEKFNLGLISYKVPALCIGFLFLVVVAGPSFLTSTRGLCREVGFCCLCLLCVAYWLCWLLQAAIMDALHGKPKTFFLKLSAKMQQSLNPNPPNPNMNTYVSDWNRNLAPARRQSPSLAHRTHASLSKTNRKHYG